MSRQLNNIIESTRQKGSTTWVLKAAIDNPRCIIVAYDKNHATQLKEKYLYLLNKNRESKWYVKLWNKIFNIHEAKINDVIYPLFIPFNSNFNGYNLPIIFDNGSLYNANNVKTKKDK